VPSITDHAGAVAAVISDGALLVAVQGNHVIGTLIAGWDGWRGNFYRLAVHPDYQRQGLARRLVAEGEKALQDKGCVRIGAIVVDDHDHAVGFWQTLGYERDNRVGRFTKTLT
jgi:ribosomal protein S18 acetylase RimI-like enzyme